MNLIFLLKMTQMSFFDLEIRKLRKRREEKRREEKRRRRKMKSFFISFFAITMAPNDKGKDVKAEEPSGAGTGAEGSSANA